MDKQYFEDLKFYATPDKEELAEIDKQLVIAQESNNESQGFFWYRKKIFCMLIKPMIIIGYYLFMKRPQMIDIYKDLEYFKVVKEDYLLTASQIFDFLIDFEGAESLLKICGFTVYSNLWQYIERKENKEEFIEKANSLNCEELALRCGFLKEILKSRHYRAVSDFDVCVEMDTDMFKRYVNDRTDYYQMHFGTKNSQLIADHINSFARFMKESSVEDFYNLIFIYFDLWAYILSLNLSSYEKDIIQSILVNKDSFCNELYESLLKNRKRTLSTGNDPNTLFFQRVFLNLPLWDKIDVSEIQETVNKVNHPQCIDTPQCKNKSINTNQKYRNAEERYNKLMEDRYKTYSEKIESLKIYKHTGETDPVTIDDVRSILGDYKKYVYRDIDCLEKGSSPTCQEDQDYFEINADLKIDSIDYCFLINGLANIHLVENNDKNLYSLAFRLSGKTMKDRSIMESDPDSVKLLDVYNDNYNRPKFIAIYNIMYLIKWVTTKEKEGEAKITKYPKAAKFFKFDIIELDNRFNDMNNTGKYPSRASAKVKALLELICNIVPEPKQ